MKQLLLFFDVKHGRLRFTLICSFLLLLSACSYAQLIASEKVLVGEGKCTVKISATALQDSICRGSSDSLNVTASGGAAPYTYLWAPPAGLSCTNCPNPVATPTVTTNYTVTVTDNNGCTATAKVRIKVNKPPKFNADTLLMEAMTNQPLSAIGGVPPYTYTFSPPVTSSNLLTELYTPATYTITVTGANGCESSDTAKYIPILGVKSSPCSSIFISEYIQDTLNHNDGIELYNPTFDTINLKDYYLFGTTNGSLFAPPFIIRLHGTIRPHKTFLIANTYADTVLTHKAKMLSDSLNFGGLDIVALANIVPNPPNVTGTLLDAVGAITPLPNDSGWAVGAGSTKNHTLERQPTITQGDIIWAACQHEWNVYPQGTFTYVGHYNNVCTPKDAQLYLSLGNDTVTCGEPSWFSFDVLIQADSAKNFNDGSFSILFPGNEFAGDNIYDGSIKCSYGDDFQSEPGNDYGTPNIGQSGNSVSVEIGDEYASPAQDTPVDTVPKVLFHFSLQIKNSCQHGFISLGPGNYYTWHYVVEDSSYSHLDSVKSSYDTCCKYQCGDTSGPLHPCDPYCCGGYDSLGNCLLTCYADSCITYPVYCEDTIWHYTLDSAYAYITYGNRSYTHVYYVDSLTTSGCPMSMDATSTPVNAGTNAISVPTNSSILNITGTGFGATKDSVLVSNANAPGMCRLDSMDILLWSENLIKIRMPSYIINNPNATPGTGPIQLYNACGGSASSNLRINYNIEQEYHPTTNEKTRLSITMNNSNASILFRCDTSISHNPQALACVKKAIRTWNCYTGVNWKLAPADTTLEVSNADNVSVIYFNNGNFGAPATLMATMQEVSLTAPCYDSFDSLAFYSEADIQIKRNLYLPNHLHWSYDTTYSSSSIDSFYFYDVILHELGHAHGLDHINDPASLMYRTDSAGRRDSIPEGSYYPGPATLYGAFDMINTSIAYNPASLPDHCGFNILVTDTKECIDRTLSVPVISQNPYNLNLYPNPINSGDITVTYQLNQNSRVQFGIIDCTGRVITKFNYNYQSAGYYKEQINIDDLAGGVYFFVANINGEIKTIKFVKL